MSVSRLCLLASGGRCASRFSSFPARCSFRPTSIILILLTRPHSTTQVRQYGHLSAALVHQSKTLKLVHRQRGFDRGHVLGAWSSAQRCPSSATLQFFSGSLGKRSYSQKPVSEDESSSSFAREMAETVAYLLVVLLLLNLIIALYYAETSLAKRYHPFKLVRREQISSDSVILTFVPDAGFGPRAEAKEPFENQQLHWGLWSVKIVKPDIVVERSYTPLPMCVSSSTPPRVPEADSFSDLIELAKKVFGFLGEHLTVYRWRDGLDPVEIQLYVRAAEGGDISNWLCTLRPGAIISMCGPDIDYKLSKPDRSIKSDLPTGSAPSKQVGDDADRVVVLAGGTGVATALQAAASRLALKEHSQVDILWASRHESDVSSASPDGIPAMFKRLQEKYPDRLNVRIFVDDKGTFIGSNEIQETVTSNLAADSKCTLIVCGSRGFVNYFTGRTHPAWLGLSVPKHKMGGLLSTIDIPSDWNVVGLW